MKSVDFSGMSPLLHFHAGDDASLAYRYYRPDGESSKGSEVLVHGSSASSNSMHVLAKAFAKAGYAAFALDMRGHGASGTKGKISYFGQLENDIDAFSRSLALPKSSTLIGFSARDGLALRFAGRARQGEFESYLLLSPFLSQNTPNYSPDSGGWVNVGFPRVFAISLLNFIGIQRFNDMPVTDFALTEATKYHLTPEYSLAHATNFRPMRDHAANIQAVHQPCSVLAGIDDEVFYTDTLKSIFRSQGKNWPVTLLAGIGHIALTLDPGAVNAAAQAVSAMRAKAS